MSGSSITVEAVLQGDGQTLHTLNKVSLPPGRVTVTIQTLNEKSRPGMLAVLEQIHERQRQRGQRPRTEAETEAEIAQLRADEEYEQRWRQIERSADPPRTAGSS